MSAIEIIFGIVLLFFAFAIVMVVLLQEGQQQQVGAMPTGNNNDTFYEKNKSRSIDAFLARGTAIISIGFAITVLALNIISYIKK